MTALDATAGAERLPAPASRHALALLRFPDPRTDWVVVTVATLDDPVDDLGDRLAALHHAVPLVGARLDGETWVAGAPPSPYVLVDTNDVLLNPSPVIRSQVMSSMCPGTAGGGCSIVLAMMTAAAPLA